MCSLKPLERTLVLSLVAATSALVLDGCAPNQNAPTATFSGPGGMVLAGSKFDRVVVANGGIDTVQIIRLAETLQNIDVVAGPAHYFPVNVPVGPNPTRVAATADGRYVFVLDVITASVRLMDADQMTLMRDATGAPLVLPLGTRAAEPTDMVGAPWPCTAHAEDAGDMCVGRAYVSLQRPGVLVAIDVSRSADGAIKLVKNSVFALGMAPARLAVHPTRGVVFATDSMSPQLMRIVVATDAALGQMGASTALDTPGHVASFSLGDQGGPLAISQDLLTVAVGRPAERDVVVFSAANGVDVAAGALVPVDANPVGVSPPECLASCAQSAQAPCAGSQLSDQSMCVTPQGYQATPDGVYGAVPIGGVPTAIAAFGGAATGSLRDVCSASNQSTQPATLWAQGYFVASLSGSVQIVGTAQEGQTHIAPRLLDGASCVAPAILSSPQSNSAPESYLASCPEMPVGRNNVACLGRPLGGGPDVGPGVVGLLRGQGNGLRMALEWEGVLPGGDRASGGGAIDADGLFVDVSPSALPFDALGIVAQHRAVDGNVETWGDVLEILTPPLGNAACMASVNNDLRACALERHITEVIPATPTRPAALRLDAPLQPACFHASGIIAYRIRAGGSFLAAPSDDNGGFVAPPVRLAPGDLYGPGRQSSVDTPIFFAIDANISSIIASNTQHASCERYNQGRAAFGMPAWMSRVGQSSFVVAEPFMPTRLGRAIDALGQQQGNMGQMPYAIVVAPPMPMGGQARSPTFVFISYVGSESVLVTTPMDTGLLASTERTDRLLGY